MSKTPREDKGGQQKEPVQTSGAPSDSVIAPSDEAQLSGQMRAQVERIYRTGWLLQFLSYANQGKPTPTAQVHNLLQTASKTSEAEEKLEARRAILTQILPAGIVVNSRFDINQLIQQMASLGIHPVRFEKGDIHLGVRPDRKQSQRRIPEFDEIAVDISRFPISTRPGAPLHDFVWRGEGIVERQLPEE